MKTSNETYNILNKHGCTLVGDGKLALEIIPFESWYKVHKANLTKMKNN